MQNIDNELIELMKKAEQKGVYCYRAERVTQTQRLLPNAMSSELDTLVDTPAYNPITKNKYQGQWFIIQKDNKEIYSCRLNKNMSINRIKNILRHI